MRGIAPCGRCAFTVQARGAARWPTLKPGKGCQAGAGHELQLVAAPQVLPLELGGRVTAAGPLNVARANARGWGFRRASHGWLHLPAAAAAPRSTPPISYKNPFFNPFSLPKSALCLQTPLRASSRLASGRRPMARPRGFGAFMPWRWLLQLVAVALLWGESRADQRGGGRCGTAWGRRVQHRPRRLVLESSLSRPPRPHPLGPCTRAPSPRPGIPRKGVRYMARTRRRTAARAPPCGGSTAAATA